jgi:hypothetical protein
LREQQVKFLEQQNKLDSAAAIANQQQQQQQQQHQSRALVHGRSSFS